MAARPAEGSGSGAARRIGVFGGTFDPPHAGHLVTARDVGEALDLDVILFIPAARPPHKPGVPLTPAPLRMEMVEAALRGEPGCRASDIELRRPGPSYTRDTLVELRREMARDAALFLILGADEFRELATWHRPEEIVRLARIVVMDRAGLEGDPGLPDVPGVGEGVQRVEVTRLDISATGIRRRVREGRSIRWLVPDPVLEIVEREGLYR